VSGKELVSLRLLVTITFALALKDTYLPAI
jgi:hypothetical protein